MILNNEKEILNIIIKPVKKYFIGMDFIQDMIKIKDIQSMKVTCKQDLDDYIDNNIVYLNKVKVYCTDLLRNQLVNFNRYKKDVIRKLTLLEDFNMDLYAKEPNKNYFKIPANVDLYNKFNIFKWNKNIDINKYMNNNFSIYKNMISKLTLDKCKSYKDLDSLVLYNKKKLSNKNEIIEFINKLYFPKETMDLLISFIEDSKYRLKIMKANSIEDLDKDFKKSIYIAFKNIEAFMFYVKNIIRILSNIYRNKMSIIYGGVSKDYNELITIEEMVMSNYNQIYQCDIFFNEGMNIDNIIKNTNIQNQIYDNNLITSVKDYVNNMYGNCRDVLNKHSLQKYKLLSYYDINNGNQIEGLSMSLDDILRLKDRDEIIKYINANTEVVLKRFNNFEFNNRDYINENIDLINESIENDYNSIMNLIDRIENNKKEYTIENTFCDIFGRNLTETGIYINDMIQEYKSHNEFNKYRNTLNSKKKYYTELFEEVNTNIINEDNDKLELLARVIHFSNKCNMIK